MTPPRTPDEEPRDESSDTPATPPPPEWLEEEQLPPGAHLLPEPPPLPPFGTPLPEDEPEDESNKTVSDIDLSKLRTQNFGAGPGIDDDQPRTTADPEAFSLPPVPEEYPGPERGPSANTTVTDLSAFLPPRAGNDESDADESENTMIVPPADEAPPQAPATIEERLAESQQPPAPPPTLIESPQAAAEPDPDQTYVEPPVADTTAMEFPAPGDDATITDAPATSLEHPAPPPFPYAQDIPSADRTPGPGAAGQEPPKTTEVPSPQPFPYAQDVPYAAPTPQAPPAPEPFPYAQQVPERQVPEPFPYAQEIPGQQQSQSPEPFPYAQQIPDRQGPEPFPYAQEIPDAQPHAPNAYQQQPAHHPVAPPPQIDEPWRTAPKKSGPKLPKVNAKPILIVVGAVAAVALVAAGGLVVFGGGDDKPEKADATAKLAGTVFARDPASAADGRNQQLTGVAAAGSTVVTVGGEADARSSRGQFLVSTDGGRSFKPAAVQGPDGGEPGDGEVPRLVTASPKGWLAIGGRPGGGAVWTSPDGQTWKRQPDVNVTSFGPADRVKRLVASGAGYLAIGEHTRKGDFSDAEPAVWISSDGQRWEGRAGQQIGLPIKQGSVNLLEAAGSGNTLLLEGLHTIKKGQAGRRVWKSDDGGKTWAESKVPAPKGTVGLMIAGGPSGFLAMRDVKGGKQISGVAFTSKDGASWTQAGNLQASGYQRVASAAADEKGYAAVVVRGKDILISRSPDAKTWQDAGSLPVQAGRTPQGTVLSADQTVLVGYDNGPDTGGDVNGLLSVWDARGTQVLADLGKVPGAVRPDHTVTAVAATGTQAVAVGSASGNGAVWSSQDGAAWTRGQGDATAFNRPGPQQLLSVTGGKAGWLAVGTDQVAPRRPYVVTSADLGSWQAADGSEHFEPARNTTLATYSAASGPAGYVIVGEDGLSASTWFSADLKSWERGKSAGKSSLEALPNSNRWMRGVTAAQSGFVAVGGLRDPAVGAGPAARPAVWTSPDGRQWTLQQLGLPAGLAEGGLGAIAAKGNLLVAAGNAASGAGPAVFAYVSADGGKTWKETKLPVPDGTKDLQVSSVTATPQGFSVTGTAGAAGRTDVVTWTSADGNAFQSALPTGTGLGGPGTQEITGQAPFKDAVIGVGRNADQKGEQPVLWSRPVS
ncbi:hypothetical protein [Spirillospora sp. CA-294931]|uniref:sialidase family protein n=1 Tax=Spirillospora sp. CA-294931 TaxID=3240042 RepID=UPI003D8EB85D